MHELDSAIHRRRGQLLEVQKIKARAGERLRIHRSIEVEADECSSSGGEVLVEADHRRIFRDVLRALARKFINSGIAGGSLALRISIENWDESGESAAT